MKFSSKTEIRSEKVARWKEENKPFHDYYKNWHRWFAWYPVPISQKEKAWLQFVERRYESVSNVVRWKDWPVYREVKK